MPSYALGWLRREIGLRFLARRKSACAVAVLTIGVAMGANTLAFSATKAFLLSTFGMPDADRLFVLAPVRELAGRGEVVFAEAYPNYERTREAQRAFSDVACMLQNVVSWQADGETRPLQGARVTASFFSTVNVNPFLGRAFGAEDEGPNPKPVAVISHALWQGAFGGARDVLGRVMVVNGEPHTVIGVMPPGFAHPLPATEVWLPFDIPPQARTAITGGRNLSVYARLKDGVTHEAALLDAENLTRLALEASADNTNYRYTLQSARQVLLPGADRTLLFVQAGALLLVILAIANLGSLLIAWGFERRQELSVRLALGARPPSVVRLLMLQSLGVVAAGGAVGIIIARVALPLIRQLDVSPALALFLQNMKLDTAVLLWSAAAIGVGGVAAGLVPAWFAGRVPVADSLRSAGRGSSLSTAAVRWQKAMILTQAALSVIIVSAAALVAVSFRKLAQIPDGFDHERRMVARIQLPAHVYGAHEARMAFADRLLDNLAREPELASFGFSSTLPVGDVRWGGRFFVEPPEGSASAEPLLLHFRRVSHTYLQTMNIPVLHGRSLTAWDRENQPPVAVVSRAAAELLWPQEDPIGKRLYRVLPGNEPPQPIEVVGVVGDVMDGGYSAPPGEAVYVPYPQISLPQLSVVVEYRRSPEQALAAVRRALRGADPGIAAHNTASLESLVRQANAMPRLQTVLLVSFALVAVSMVALGSYGVMTQLVASRERELALRLSLGAAPYCLGSSVLAQVTGLSAAGAALGMFVVRLLSGALQPLVFGIEPRSITLLASVALAVLLLSGAAALAPAVRAMRVDPRRTLAAA